MTNSSDRVLKAIELAPGYRISPLITGCWQLASDHGAASASRDELFRRWRLGIEEGYTTFDCADIYTGVEELLGRFLSQLDEPDRVQAHTKYVPDRAALATLDRATVERAVERSLDRLGREAIDLLQFHWWDYSVPGAIDAAVVLNELRQAGKIRHLGLTNFDLDHVRQIVDAGVEVTSLQVQYSILDRRPERELAPWCKARDIALLSYGTLAGGLLTDRYRGAPDMTAPAVNRSLTKYRLIVDEFGGWAALQEALGALGAIGRRHRVSTALVALRWAIERSGVAAAIVGISSEDRRDELRELWRGDWAEEEWRELQEVLERHAGPQGTVYGLERDPEGPHLGILRMGLNSQ